MHSTGAELPQQTAANPSSKAPSQHAPGQTSCPTLTHPKTHKKQKEPSQRLLGCFAVVLFIYSHCCDCHYYRTQHNDHDHSLFCSTLHHRPLCISKHPDLQDFLDLINHQNLTKLSFRVCYGLLHTTQKFPSFIPLSVSQLHVNSYVQLHILQMQRHCRHMVSPNEHILLNLPDFKHSK